MVVGWRSEAGEVKFEAGYDVCSIWRRLGASGGMSLQAGGPCSYWPGGSPSFCKYREG